MRNVVCCLDLIFHLSSACAKLWNEKVFDFSQTNFSILYVFKIEINKLRELHYTPASRDDDKNKHENVYVKITISERTVLHPLPSWCCKVLKFHSAYVFLLIRILISFAHTRFRQIRLLSSLPFDELFEIIVCGVGMERWRWNMHASSSDASKSFTEEQERTSEFWKARSFLLKILWLPWKFLYEKLLHMKLY